MWARPLRVVRLIRPYPGKDFRESLARLLYRSAELQGRNAAVLVTVLFAVMIPATALGVYAAARWSTSGNRVFGGSGPLGGTGRVLLAVLGFYAALLVSPLGVFLWEGLGWIIRWPKSGGQPLEALFVKTPGREGRRKTGRSFGRAYALLAAFVVLDVAVGIVAGLLLRSSPALRAAPTGAFLFGVYITYSGFAAYGAAGLLAVCLVMPLAAVQERRERTALVDAYVVGKVLRAFGLASQPRTWADLRSRGVVIRQVEAAAAAIEYGLPRSLKSGEAGTDRWVRDRARRIAAGLREVKYAAATPKGDSREWLMGRLGETLRHVALGTWDDLKTAEPPPAEHGPRQLIRRAGAVLRGLLVGLLPLAALVAFRRIHPAGDVPAWATAALLGWAVVNGLLLLDPLLSVRTDAFKSVVESLAPWTKRKD